MTGAVTWLWLSFGELIDLLTDCDDRCRLCLNFLWYTAPFI